MVLREIFIRKWWMFAVTFSVILLGLGYGWYRMTTDPYVEYWAGSGVEEELDQILLEQKELSAEEQMNVFLAWQAEVEERAADLSESGKKEELDRLNGLLNLYQNAISGKISANNLILLAKGEETILFDGNIPGDFLENREAYAGMKEASLVNPLMIARFFGLEQFDVSFLAGILFAVCFWGSHYENGTNRQLASASQGKIYRLRCHDVLLLAVALATVIAWLIAMAGSGLLFKPQYWDAMLRGYDWTMHHLNSLLLSMTVMEFCLLLLVVHLANGVLFYVISCWFVAAFQNIRSAFLGSFGVLLAMYFIGSIFSSRGEAALFQFGYRGDWGYLVTYSRWLPSCAMTTLELGAILVVAVTILSLAFWLWRELRNPYGKGGKA